jgi:hypothetical protein
MVDCSSAVPRWRFEPPRAHPGSKWSIAACGEIILGSLIGLIHRFRCCSTRSLIIFSKPFRPLARTFLFWKMAKTALHRNESSLDLSRLPRLVFLAFGIFAIHGAYVFRTWRCLGFCFVTSRPSWSWLADVAYFSFCVVLICSPNFNWSVSDFSCVQCLLSCFWLIWVRDCLSFRFLC